MISNTKSPTTSASRTQSTVERELAAAACIPDAQIRLQTVIAMVGLKTSTIYKRMGEGDFPPPAARHNARCVRWRAGDIKDWLAARSKPGNA